MLVGLWVGGLFPVINPWLDGNVFEDEGGVIVGFKFYNISGEDIGVIASFKA